MTALRSGRRSSTALLSEVQMTNIHQSSHPDRLSWYYQARHFPCRRIVTAQQSWNYVGREYSEQPDQSHSLFDVTTSSTRHAQGETVFKKGKAISTRVVHFAPANGKICHAPHKTWLQMVSSGSRLGCGGKERAREPLSTTPS